MSILSSRFFLFVAAAIVLYYAIPKRSRWVILLIASISFLLWCSGFECLPFVLLTVIVTYCGSRIIEKSHKTARKRLVLGITIVIPVIILLFTKTLNSFSINMMANIGFSFLSSQIHTNFAPLGISYFTLSAISYVLDVYWDKTGAQRNILIHALYVCYFPVLTSGPVLNYTQIMPRLLEGHDFDYTSVKFGFQRMLWGCLKKLVIADRLAIITGAIFADTSVYHGLYIPTAVLLFAFQIYMDFSGCMDICLGTSEAFQIYLPENFRQPFFAQTLSEFWRRWHITLGLWAKDYILYPLLKTELFQKIGTLGKKVFGKRVGKAIPTYIGLGVVWLVIGIWHGGSIKYIFAAGFLPWLFVVSGQLLKPFFDWLTKVLRVEKNCFSYRLFSRLRTLFIMCIIWFFANAVSSRESISRIKDLFLEFNPWIFTDGSLYTLGLDYRDMFLLTLCFLLVLIIDILKEKGYELRVCIARQNLVFRWALYLGAIFFVLIFGLYGSGFDVSNFIYAGF